MKMEGNINFSGLLGCHSKMKLLVQKKKKKNNFGRQENVLISLIVYLYLFFSKHTEYDNNIGWD